MPKTSDAYKKLNKGIKQKNSQGHKDIQQK